MKKIKDIISGLIIFVPMAVVLLLIGVIYIILKITGSILWLIGLREYTLGKSSVKISITDKDKKKKN